MLGVSLKDKKRATWIRQQTKVEDILKTIKKKKWQWAGHIYRRQDNRWTKKTAEWVIHDTKRPRARPMTRWRDEIAKFAGVNWNQRTQDRNDWKRLREAYVLQWIDTG